MTDQVSLKRVCELSYMNDETIAVQWFNAQRDGEERVMVEWQNAACGFVHWVGGMVGLSDQERLAERFRACIGEGFRRGIAEQLGAYRVDVPPISESFEPVYSKRMYRIGVPVSDPTIVLVTHEGFGLRLGKAQNHYLPISPFALLASLDQLWEGDPAQLAFLQALCQVATQIMETRSAHLSDARGGYDTTQLRDQVLGAVVDPPSAPR